MNQPIITPALLSLLPIAPKGANKVIVGMSGGVDSSLTAALLSATGWKVEGLFMKNWDEDDGSSECTAVTDLADAQKVCDQLGIRLHSVNFATEYWDEVFTHFLAEYRLGRTPNPDILCNREIKFKVFLQYAKLLGADKIATGHYVRSDEQGRLYQGLDATKDQSYFLSAVKQSALQMSLFPLGSLTKIQVRTLAQAWQLATAQKKDSTGICFIGERRFNEFLQRYLPAQPGQIIDLTGHILGEHLGLMYYTIGQRQGLHLGGKRNYQQAPWFVAGKDLINNRLIVVQGSEHPALFANTLTTECASWIDDQIPTAIFTAKRLNAKIRYRQETQSCQVTINDKQQLTVNFSQPQRAITPGQSLVLYEQDRCLGGAIIKTAQIHPSLLQVMELQENDYVNA